MGSFHSKQNTKKKSNKNTNNLDEDISSSSSQPPPYTPNSNIDLLYSDEKDEETGDVFAEFNSNLSFEIYSDDVSKTIKIIDLDDLKDIRNRLMNFNKKYFQFILNSYTSGENIKYYKIKKEIALDMILIIDLLLAKTSKSPFPGSIYLSFGSNYGKDFKNIDNIMCIDNNVIAEGYFTIQQIRNIISKISDSKISGFVPHNIRDSIEYSYRMYFCMKYNNEEFRVDPKSMMFMNPTKVIKMINMIEDLNAF